MRILFLFLLSIFSLTTFSQNLLLTPNRIVFEKNSKPKVLINIVNIGKDTATYSISFINYKMTKTGSFEQITEEDSLHMFSEPYLRIFPRKVTLNPGEPQVIALQIRKKSNMELGEYRSHAYFRGERPKAALGEEDKFKKDTTSFSVDLIPIFGMSFPVIYRNIENNMTVDITNQKYTRENMTDFVDLDLQRGGDTSFYGDIEVEYAPIIGEKIIVGRINGVGVYTDITLRQIRVRLNNTDLIDFSSGKLFIRAKIKDKYSKERVLNEAVIEL
ncbi:MAG: hypothetical protein KAH07_07845 [Flavobacteriaceae bacterium]|nr:hypothetical protein [Flavobacteriaceae bacterium]